MASLNLDVANTRERQQTAAHIVAKSISSCNNASLRFSY